VRTVGICIKFVFELSVLRLSHRLELPNDWGRAVADTCKREIGEYQVISSSTRMGCAGCFGSRFSIAMTALHMNKH
jgi:hypothetical protein